MKFKSNSLLNAVEIGELKIGDTFIDLKNFKQSDVLMVVSVQGCNCCVEFYDNISSIAAIDLTSGEMWGYESNEIVIPVETGEVPFNR